MVIDDLPQWIERFFVFFALIMMLGICNACWHLGAISSQLEELRKLLGRHDTHDIGNDIGKARDALDLIRMDVELIADADRQRNAS